MSKVINLSAESSKEREDWVIQTWSTPPGLHYCEMKTQAGAPPVELIGSLAN